MPNIHDLKSKKRSIKDKSIWDVFDEHSIYISNIKSTKVGTETKKVGTKVGTETKKVGTETKKVGTKVGTETKKVGTKVGTETNGIALLVYQYFLQKLNSKKDLVTEYINSTSLSLYIGKSGNSIRQSIKRMKKANIIKTINIIDGRKGSAQYQIDRNFYKNFKKLNKKDPSINNSNNKKLLLLDKKKEIKQSEKLGIERKDEPKQRNWSNINIEPLRKYGLNERHLEDIREFNLLDREVVQESIYHFAFALEENKIKYENPIGVLVGRLCKGKGWFEAEYISELERSLINSRTKAGIKLAREQGTKFGRKLGSKNKKTDHKVERIKIFLTAKKSYAWISNELSVSKQTISDIKKQMNSFVTTN